MNAHTLLQLDVSHKTEKKVNLTYLSWAWAWAEALKADPKATFKVKTFFRDQYTEEPFMTLPGGTAMVWVTVTMFDKEMTCQLPVMDNRNKAIVNPDAFQVNTAIMRCMTKALGLHGLGLYIYAGEDLPEGVEPESTIEEDSMTELFAAIENATTQDELKLAFKVAYAACDGEKVWQLKVIAAKDKVKAKLNVA